MEIKGFSTSCRYEGNYSTSVNILSQQSKNMTSNVTVNDLSMIYTLAA
jgi:hypothetical protein